MIPLISIIIPCYKRPLRTIRCLNSILQQNFENWEAIFIGDNCPDFQGFINNGVFKEYKEKEAIKGNTLIFENLNRHYGGWGSMCRQVGINIARGKYICFLDNDDIVLPDHLSNYSGFMETNPDLDFAYFNARTEPWKRDRNSVLSRGGIGNAELLFKANVLRKEYEVDLEYEHDWRLVDKLMKKGYKYAKCNNSPTYIIMSVPNYREEGID